MGLVGGEVAVLGEVGGEVEERPAVSGVVEAALDVGALAELVLLEGADCQIEIIAGRSGPEGGWIGTGYGYRQRAPVARFFGRFQLPVAFSFAIESLHSPSTENG